MVNILHNDSARSIANHVNRAGHKADESLMRLATGRRIVSFGDDTASSAMASQLGLEVLALGKAALNATQATSMLNTAEAMLQWDNDVMMQMDALAAQAASGQVSPGQRAMLDQTFQALKLELNRVATTAEFNGISLLSGTAESEAAVPMALVVDSNVTSGGTNSNSQPITGVAYNFDAGSDATALEVQYQADSQNCNTGGTFTIRDINTNLSQSIAVKVPTDSTVNNYRFDSLNMTLSVDKTFAAGTSFAFSSNSVGNAGTGRYLPNSGMNNNDNIKIVAFSGKIDDIEPVTSADGSSNVYALDTLSFSSSGTTQPDPSNAVFTLPVKSPGNASFISQSVDLTTVGRKSINLSRQRQENGQNFTDNLTVEVIVTQPFSAEDLQSSASANSTRIVLGQLKNLVVAEPASSQNTGNTFSFLVGSGASGSIEDNTFTFTLMPVTTKSLGIDALSIGTQDSAQKALSGIHAGVNALNSVRDQVGASQKIIEMISSAIEVEIENNESAVSALTSVDFAKEISDLSNTTIVVQAGYSALNRSIQLAENAMTLLRG